MKSRNIVFCFFVLAYWAPIIYFGVTTFGLALVLFPVLAGLVFFPYYLNVLATLFIINPDLSKEATRRLGDLHLKLFYVFFFLVPTVYLLSINVSFLSIFLIGIFFFVLYTFYKFDEISRNNYLKYQSLPEEVGEQYLFVKDPTDGNTLGYSRKLLYSKFEVRTPRKSAFYVITGTIESNEKINNKVRVKYDRRWFSRYTEFRPQNRLSNVLNSKPEISELIKRIDLDITEIRYGSGYTAISIMEWFPNKNHITVAFFRKHNINHYDSINLDIMRLFELIGEGILEVSSQEIDLKKR